MSIATSFVAPGRRVRSLALGMASTFGALATLGWPAAVGATTLNVTNCLDSGAGSLRDVVAAAGNADTINLDTNLPCSTISLTSGAIDIAQDTLYLSGPGAGINALSISGGGHYGVLRHSGKGRLGITGLTLRDGKYVSDNTPRGGCVYSAGNVTLVDSTVFNCAVQGNSNAVARGGGLYARGTFGMSNSRISGNVAFGTAANSRGGGVYVKGTMVATDSVFSDNEASTVSAFSQGGGLWVAGNTYLRGSLVSGNKAALAAALGSESYKGGTFVGIVNSTISGNVASFRFGGIYVKVPLTLGNSTVAFNEAPDGGAVYSVGETITLQSSIIADNVAGGQQADLDGAINPKLVGYDNLITSSTIGFPAGTITACPKLGPLAANGNGTILTHALLADSPAVNAGFNEFNLQTDQRGAGFPRIAGASADIGAYERQGGADDRIHTSGFEPVCDH